MRNIIVIVAGFLLLSVSSAYAAVSLDISNYCEDGYYKIPGEEVCSRAPNCGGKGYDELNTTSKMKNAKACMGDGDGREERGCSGYVPLCCYEMARTGDYTKCIGYWERLWCSQDLCKEAKGNGASDSQCGGSCQCAHAHKSYCGDNKTSVPIEQRLLLQGQAPPTATPRPTSRPVSQITQRPTSFLSPTLAQPSNTPIPTVAIPTPIPTTQSPTIFSAPTSTVTISFGSPTESIPEIVFTADPFEGIAQLRSKIEPDKIVAQTVQMLDGPKKLTNNVKQADIALETTVTSWWMQLLQRIQSIVT